MEKTMMGTLCYVILSGALILSGGLAMATQPDDCAPQLMALDKSVMEVSNDLASLSFELGREDSNSPLAVKLAELLREKMEILNAIIPTEPLRAAIKEYIKRQVLLLEKEHIFNEESGRRVEAEQRIEEQKLLAPYNNVKLEVLEESHLTDVRLTPEGVVVTKNTYGNLLFHDLNNDKLSSYDRLLSPRETLFAFGAGEVFDTDHLITAVKIKDILESSAQDPENIKRERVFSFAEDVQRRIHAVIKSKWPRSWADLSNLSRGVQVSNNGNVFVFPIWLRNEDADSHEGFVVFNRRINKVDVINIGSKMHIHRDAAAWAISPDGKHLAARSEESIVIYNLASGDEVNSFGVRSRSVSFSNDGARIVVNHTSHYLVSYDITGRTPARYYPIEKYIDHNDENTWPEAVVFSADDSRIIANNKQGRIWIFDTQTKELLESLKLPGRTYFFSKDNQFILTKEYLEKGGVGSTLWRKN